MSFLHTALDAKDVELRMQYKGTTACDIAWHSCGVTVLASELPYLSCQSPVKAYVIPSHVKCS